MTKLSGVQYTGRENNFERDYYATVAEMVAAPGNGRNCPPMVIAMCGETNKAYLYKKENEEDATLGKWRAISIATDESGTVLPEAKAPLVLTAAEYEALETKDPEVLYLIKEE
jgi:hypothetical protein